ncbi:hypothetical protein NC653_004819 [Populus alba x Populus x berolinensis]|uniref:Uncharacterized protein n=1 Tax=Populus alba x Populus x berolinensis TaxID=444605 RepID=A0AAD6RVD3_9ROSI|nr:hypothetical protein NC653_004819 [Populus alba x Populus x berolinensis]
METWAKGGLLDEDLGLASDSVKSLTSQMNELAVSSNSAVVAPSSDLADASQYGSLLVQDIDKRILAKQRKITCAFLILKNLSKNLKILQIRLAEAQQQKTSITGYESRGCWRS